MSPADKTHISYAVIQPCYDFIGAAFEQFDLYAGIVFLIGMNDCRKPVSGDAGKRSDGQMTGVQFL